MPKKIAIIGGGPSALFLLNEFVRRDVQDRSIEIFEAAESVATGMPYSAEGAENEHVTNLSCEEIPDLAQLVQDWLTEQPPEFLDGFGVKLDEVTDLSILPRRLFGKYLKDQFDMLEKLAAEKGLSVKIHLGARVTDIKDLPSLGKIVPVINGNDGEEFDRVILATGHVWPKDKENLINGYFDSPYPPKKLKHIFNQHVALRGASLTSVDAIKTLAKTHGHFEKNAQGELVYLPDEGTENFKITMHTRQGILPGLRFHFEHPRVERDRYVSQEMIDAHKAQNNGLISLDFLFEKGFKDPIRDKEPEFYAVIQEMSVEEFVKYIFDQQRSDTPFDYFKTEFKISKASLAKQKPVHWKETVAFLSAAVNFSAKHMPAEDIIRIHTNLMPLVANVVAHLPHDSAEELIALYDAGKLDLVAVGYNNQLTTSLDSSGATYSYTGSKGHKKEVHYDTFIDCVGQRQLPFEMFPFPTLINDGVVAPACVDFSSAREAFKAKATGVHQKIVQTANDNYSLEVPGLKINDSLQVIGTDNVANPRIYIMAVPYIGGLNPDFSGLDFCEDAARLITDHMFGDIVPINKSQSPVCECRIG